MASAFDVIQVIAEMAILGQRVMNVWELMSPSAVSDDDIIDDVQVAIEDVIYSVINPAIPDNLTYESLYFKNLTQNEDMGQFDWLSLTAGESAGEVLPLGVAALLTFPTAQPKVRGRKFLPPFAETNLTDALWGSATVTLLSTVASGVAAGFIGDVSSEPYVFGVSNQAGLFRPFIEGLTTNIPAYQRRRKQGVGE